LLSSTLFLAACEDNSNVVPSAGMPVDAANGPEAETGPGSQPAPRIAAGARGNPAVRSPGFSGASRSGSTVQHAATPAPVRTSPMSVGSSMFGGSTHMTIPSPSVHTGGSVSTVHGGFGSTSAVHATPHVTISLAGG